LPEAGISQKDIQNACRHGHSILESIIQNKYDDLQQKLLLEGAVEVKYHLTCIEKNARKIFDIFANYILKKGGASEAKRKGRIQQFKAYLLFVFFALSPLFSFIFIVKRWVLYPLVEKEINYYKGTKLIIK
jgi:hypothetical protein